MSRSRNIKPSFFTNDVLAECEPLARLIFIGLWTIADREGRLEDRPKKIKAEVLPYDDCNANEMLTQLEKNGFIVRYEALGSKYIQILNFVKHQNPHVKETASTIPAPDKTGASTVQNVPLTDSLLPLTESNISPTSGEEIAEEVWKIWPQERRCEYPDFLSHWRKAAKKAPPTEILSAVKRYLTTREATDGFAPYPAKWLKGERWLEASQPEFLSSPDPPNIEKLRQYAANGVKLTPAQEQQLAEATAQKY